MDSQAAIRKWNFGQQLSYLGERTRNPKSLSQISGRLRDRRQFEGISGEEGLVRLSSLPMMEREPSP